MRPSLILSVLLATTLAVGIRAAPATERGADPKAEWIARAGNARDDATRLEALRELRRLPDLDAALASDADRLIAEIERWIGEKRLDYFGGTVSRVGDYDFKIRAGSPLEPLTWLYRGRMITWVTLESGGIWSIPERRREWLDRARGFFEKAAAAFPDEPIARMYLGTPIPAPRTPAPVPNAPDWAIAQREGLERLTDIIEWWIDNRMQADGQYGGGWGDDCEMWRWWVPILIGFETPKVEGAQIRFSEALLAQPHVAPGYMTQMTDVEHSAEDLSDALTPLMHLAPDDPAHRARAMRLVDLMENLWTGRNERGFLQFKSTYFTATEVDPDPKRACDTVYHPRALQPALLLWQRTGDERMTRLFSAWMDTWVDAAARSERGKPVGILPSAIHWPDGQVGGAGPDWWDPRNHGEYTLYLFPSAMDMMLHTLLLTYHMTGKETYFEPIRSMARIRTAYLKNKPAGDPEPGSEAWCASRIGGIAGVAAKYRLLTRNQEFYDLLALEMPAYLKLRLRDDRDDLTRALERNAEALRINFEGYTSEVRYTDRVLRFPSLFGANGMFPEPLRGIPSPDPGILYSSATGDPGDAGYFPMNAVRWLTPSRGIAALVTRATKHGLDAHLFHFGDKDRPMAAEFYLLEPGRYSLTVSGSAPREFTVTGPRARVEFTIPPRRLVDLEVLLESPCIGSPDLIEGNAEEIERIKAIAGKAYAWAGRSPEGRTMRTDKIRALKPEPLLQYVARVFPLARCTLRLQLPDELSYRQALALLKSIEAKSYKKRKQGPFEFGMDDTINPSWITGLEYNAKTKTISIRTTKRRFGGKVYEFRECEGGFELIDVSHWVS